MEYCSTELHFTTWTWTETHLFQALEGMAYAGLEYSYEVPYTALGSHFASFNVEND